jgi:16S rRNA (cytosine967-C5)-methyltransferase
MNPAARIKATLDLLDRALTAHIPMDAVAGDYFRFRKYIGSHDRADIAERYYRVMRHFGRLSWWVKKLDIAGDARALMLLHLRLVYELSPEDINDLFDGSQYGPDPLADDERQMLNDLADATLEPDDMDAATRVECPAEQEERLRAVFGENFEAEMIGMQSGAPLDLRVNLLKCTAEQSINMLAKDNVAGDPTPFCPWGIRLREKTFLSNTKAFREGFVDIQDEGSQLIGLVCAAAPGQQVLDYCAGAGGKTLALAGTMANKGRIVAMDLEGARLEKARPRFRRAGVHDIIEVRPLSDEKHRKWFKRQKGTFDVTLVDAPCSGSGTWRRNPDMRWRNYGPDFAELLTTQAEILEKVANTVKPGGRLVYATCSLYREENEDQVEAFLAKHPEYKVLPLAAAWPAQTPVPGDGPYLRLTPDQHNTDGFFAAILQRIS